MAVTRIHRTSKLVLYATIIISIVVLGLFFLGGQAPEKKKIVAEMSQPMFTDVVLYWMYALLVITVAVWVFFIIASSLKQLKDSPKKTLGGLLALVGLAALMLIAFVAGDGTVLNIPGYKGSDNRTPMLKMTDMWLYSIYIMFFLTVLAMIVLPLFAKKK